MTTSDGTPLAVTITAANTHDLKQLLTLVLLEFPKVGGKPGRPLDRPITVTADKAYDCKHARSLLRSIDVEPFIPRRKDSPLGNTRWPVERTISWLKQFRRLRIRWDRLLENFQAFVQLASGIIAWRKLKH